MSKNCRFQELKRILSHDLPKALKVVAFGLAFWFSTQHSAYGKEKEPLVIPALNQSGVLPPFIQEFGPTSSAAMAPYGTSMAAVASRFTSTPERKAIFEGLLNFREQLRQAGLVEGFQWLAGSYLEDCERYRGRPPKDVDIVTFARRPTGMEEMTAWQGFVQQNMHVFDKRLIKDTHMCDSYHVDLSLPTEAIVSSTRFWFGLFSHQRDTYLWKGILAVPLIDDDEAARQILAGGE
ncbi:DUF6932 family protein [Pseudomonas aeruginosa]|uniref:DUF6932 family protein n=1 Tax=Pseudomonas aeruginosa TaxID=287 RepID=UPI003BA8E058